VGIFWRVLRIISRLIVVRNIMAVFLFAIVQFVLGLHAHESKRLGGCVCRSRTHWSQSSDGPLFVYLRTAVGPAMPQSMLKHAVFMYGGIGDFHWWCVETVSTPARYSGRFETNIRYFTGSYFKKW
jgi:hypothetical protein